MTIFTSDIKPVLIKIEFVCFEEMRIINIFETSDLSLQQFPLLSPNFIFVNDKYCPYEFCPNINSFPEFIELIADHRR